MCSLLSIFLQSVMSHWILLFLVEDCRISPEKAAQIHAFADVGAIFGILCSGVVSDIVQKLHKRDALQSRAAARYVDAVPFLLLLPCLNENQKSERLVLSCSFPPTSLHCLLLTSFPPCLPVLPSVFPLSPFVISL